MATKKPELLPGTLEMLILKTLTRGPNHGYGIAQDVQRVSGDALRIGEGSLYPALQRLLIDNWARVEWGTFGDRPQGARLHDHGGGPQAACARDRGIRFSYWRASRG